MQYEIGMFIFNWGMLLLAALSAIALAALSDCVGYKQPSPFRSASRMVSFWSSKPWANIEEFSRPILPGVCFCNLKRQNMDLTSAAYPLWTRKKIWLSLS